MVGINMSGDLKNPSRSIPKGTFAAVGVGHLIYMVLPILLANRADAMTLIEDPMVMWKMSYRGDAILIGVSGATLSSALGSIIGAPRVLQALVRDKILPPWLDWLGNGSGEDDSPRLDTIFMGMAKPDENFVGYYKKLQSWIHKLPTTILVLAAKDICFGEVLLHQDKFRNG